MILQIREHLLLVYILFCVRLQTNVITRQTNTSNAENETVWWRHDVTKSM